MIITKENVYSRFKRLTFFQNYGRQLFFVVSRCFIGVNVKQIKHR